MQPLSHSFVLVIPVRNAGALVEECIESAMDQRHPDLGIVIRDDCSTDDTASRVARILGVSATPGTGCMLRVENRRTVLFVRGTHRLYPAGALHRVLHGLVGRPDAVVGVLDGDDRLTTPDALETMHALYRADPALWVAWSQHRTASGRPGCSRALPTDEGKLSSRMYWAASHLRTARAWLMRRVRAEDLQDPRTGAAYTAIAGDAAFTFPMLEMAGHAHSRFRDEVLYHYNDTLPTNEAARDAESVHWYSYAIRMRGRRYPRLSEPCDGPAEPTSPPWEQRDAPIPPFE